MITRKSTYALRALAEIARDPERLHSIADLAAQQGIPKAYLALIFAALRRDGIIAGLRGPTGGYTLARCGTEISLAAVVATLDGPLFPMACIDPLAEPCAECPGTQECAARRVLGRASAAAWKALESMAVSDLASPDSVQPANGVRSVVSAELVGCEGTPQSRRG